MLLTSERVASAEAAAVNGAKKNWTRSRFFFFLHSLSVSFWKALLLARPPLFVPLAAQNGNHNVIVSNHTLFSLNNEALKTNNDRIFANLMLIFRCVYTAGPNAKFRFDACTVVA